jgi:serine phosphatase RsbU (regulator of sigma subunit)
MKILIILLFTNILNAQTIDTIFVNADSLDRNSISINDFWKFKSGDDSSWASSTYNDTSWEIVTPKFGLNDSLLNKWTGIGWFRKPIRIDSSLVNKSILLSISQYGASEIYLNGVLVVKFGIVSDSLEFEKIYQPNGIPVVVNFTDKLNYTLAIRFSNHKVITEKEYFLKWFDYAGFTAEIYGVNNSIKSLINNGRLNFGVNFAIFGMFFSLAVLYFILFFFYSKRKENLYYSLFTFSLALLFPASLIQKLFYSDLNLEIAFGVLGVASLSFSFIFYLAFLYSIFYVKIPKLYYSFVILGFIILFGLFTKYTQEIANYLLPILIIASSIEGMRVIIIAYKKNKAHHRVIGIGVLVFFLIIISILVVQIFGLKINNIVMLIMILLGLFSLPASMSVYQAKDIASTNKSLEKQLITVKELSLKELETQKKNAELQIIAERELAENDRKTKELEEARQLQLSMLPKELPNLPNLDIAVYMKTATEVGGDYYDFNVGIDGTLTIVIGDATGHGMRAGTMVTATKSLFSSHANNPDILSTFQEFTRCIKQLNMNMISMCLSLVKIKNNLMQISAAGMPPALLYRKETQQIEEIILKGMPLGVYQNFPYQLKQTELFPGDTLLLLSDGFPEMFNKNKELFGYERVFDTYQKVAEKNPEQIIDELNNAGSNWLQNELADDDITFVVIKVK